MRNVYLILKRSVVAVLLLFCQIAMAHPFEHGFSTMAADTLLPDSPRIAQFAPASGGKGTAVTIFGLHLTGTTVVRFGGVKASSFTILSDTFIRAIVDSGATGAVSVTTPGGSASKSGFTFIRDTIPPVSDTPRIISFAPTSGKKGTVVSIVGVHFTGTTAVRFGGVLADSIWVVTDSIVKARVNTGATGSVSVTTPSGTASRAGFTFIQDTIPPVSDTPRIISFSPTIGRKGTVVTIFGVHFTGTTAVRFGGVRADSIWVLADSIVKARVDTGATGSVSVTTPRGTASRAGFTFIRDTVPPVSDTPRIISFTPISGKKGTAVTIFGEHFTGATSARLGGVLASSIIVYSDTIIKAIVGNGASGAVSVTTPAGTTSRLGFTFIPDSTSVPDTTIHDTIPPHIYKFFPTSAKRGDSVYISGHYFLYATGVKFGGVAANRFVVLSDTLIRAVVDNGASGAVSVISSAGLSAKNGFTFIPDSTGTPDSLARVANVNTTVDSRSFGLFPNPASGYAIWKQPASDHISYLQLVDLSGRIVKTITVGKNAVQTTIPVSGLPAGMYKIVWSDGKSKLTKSLLIK